MKPTTKQRLVNDLKAALNAAYSANRKRLDAKFPAIIRHGLKTDRPDLDEASPVARESQILSDAQVGQLLRGAREIDAEQGWDGDLFRLFVILASTGARFSQVARLRVGDLQRTQKRLMVPVSRKGRDGKTGSVPVPIGMDVLETLVPVLTGRAKDALLLERWRYMQVAGTIRWQRSGRGPWLSASELTRPWQAIRTRANLPDAIPYALRHSSIVRGIRANLPIRLVAALHDTSVQMIERHYSRWIADGLNELAVRAIVPLLADDDRIIQLACAR
jgi:Site-specific recombinase XerD